MWIYSDKPDGPLVTERSHDMPDLFLALPLICPVTFANHLTSLHLQIPFMNQKNNVVFYYSKALHSPVH